MKVDDQRLAHIQHDIFVELRLKPRHCYANVVDRRRKTGDQILTSGVGCPGSTDTSARISNSNGDILHNGTGGVAYRTLDVA